MLTVNLDDFHMQIHLMFDLLYTMQFPHAHAYHWEVARKVTLQNNIKPKHGP